MDFLDGGKFPNRPNNADFWRLSSIVLKYDGRMQEASSDEERDAEWNKTVAEHVDEKSLVYMAMQRTFRILNIQTNREIAQRADDVARLTTVWSEGFLVGAEFAKDQIKGHGLDELDETGLRLLLSNYERHAKDRGSRGEEPMTVAEFFETF